jgi:hypothetical protein
MHKCETNGRSEGPGCCSCPADYYLIFILISLTVMASVFGTCWQICLASFIALNQWTRRLERGILSGGYISSTLASEKSGRPIPDQTKRAVKQADEERETMYATNVARGKKLLDSVNEEMFSPFRVLSNSSLVRRCDEEPVTDVIHSCTLATTRSYLEEPTELAAIGRVQFASQFLTGLRLRPGACCDRRMAPKLFLSARPLQAALSSGH